MDLGRPIFVASKWSDGANSTELAKIALGHMFTKVISGIMHNSLQLSPFFLCSSCCST